VLRASVALFVLLVSALFVPSSAFAQTCEEMPCSVIRNCSSTGMACRLDDRDCAESARRKSLEVKCEQPCSDAKRLVYCPPDTGRADDSRVVWVLLSVAVLLASVGGTVAWLVLRAPKSSTTR
jgi:hypothetical protein